MSKLQTFNTKLDSMIEDVKSLAKTDDETYYQGKLDIFKKSKYLTGSEVGEVISVNDMSSVESNLNIKLSKKNLIPYPYKHTTRTENGITFTDNVDGTITVNGTSTGQAFFVLNTINIEAGSYFLSGCIGSAVINLYDSNLDDLINKKTEFSSDKQDLNLEQIIKDVGEER